MRIIKIFSNIFLPTIFVFLVNLTTIYTESAKFTWWNFCTHVSLCHYLKSHHITSHQLNKEKNKLIKISSPHSPPANLCDFLSTFFTYTTKKTIGWCITPFPFHTILSPFTSQIFSPDSQVFSPEVRIIKIFSKISHPTIFVFLVNLSAIFTESAKFTWCIFVTVQIVCHYLKLQHHLYKVKKVN